MKIKKFEELRVWQLSIQAAQKIYQLTNKVSFLKDHGLRNQLRRSVVSISSNIAEGYEKNNNNELIRYLKIAKGSLGETRSQFYIAYEIKYINQSDYVLLNRKLIDLSNQIGKFISYLTNKRESGHFINSK